MRYKVTVRGYVERVCTVEANSEGEAETKVKNEFGLRYYDIGSESNTNWKFIQKPCIVYIDTNKGRKTQF